MAKNCAVLFTTLSWSDEWKGKAASLPKGSDVKVLFCARRRRLRERSERKVALWLRWSRAKPNSTSTVVETTFI
jgi:hypothetical protein